MKTVDPAAAVAAIEDGSTVIFPGACANPQAFFQAFSTGVERFSSLTVMSGLSLGDYSFLTRGLGENFRYLTWQAAPRIRHLFKENDPRKVGFVPLRLSDVTRVLRRDGPLPFDTVLGLGARSRTFGGIVDQHVQRALEAFRQITNRSCRR